ncbi:hypothetical protein [Acinetobacter sp. ANC 4648]|uniref:hypothetical protein n=1 Tax=Acinetobacter sp. ANC 4648 TaxID=1977875 RepID=UPI000A359D65|nr:hypothetical protein [Acinetobacter sp. ANC 4648]OTG80275.1 hypothetical protein B9T27_12940 [Acinetobacter sp. ANC 4648]
MYITNKTDFPIITLSYKFEDKQSLDDLFGKFEALFAKNQKFIFISSGTFDEAEQDGDHESRKRAAAWVKANRVTLSERVLGLVHIEKVPEQKAKAEQFSKMYSQFSGYLMYVVASKQESDMLIDKLLNT